MGKAKTSRGQLAVKDFGPNVIKDRLLAALDIKSARSGRRVR